MINRVFNYLANTPIIFNILRNIVEFGFITPKKTIKAELNNINPGQRILDLGCGTGEFVQLFEDYDYHGIDNDLQYIEYAQRKYNSRKFYFMDASKMTFKDNYFNAVFIIGVLHHMDDELCGCIFKEIKRVIKKHGKIIIMENLNPESKTDFLGNLFRKLDNGNFIRTKEEYIKLLSNDFNINYTNSFRSGFIKYHIIQIYN